MNSFLSRLRLPIRISPRALALIFLALLAIGALVDFWAGGLVRRTFVFYAIDSGIATVEERLLRVAGKNRFAGAVSETAIREANITRYVEEALLGPISPNAVPLFPQETRLVSLLYRNGVVYADLSEDAVLPPPENASAPHGDMFTRLETLYQGVRRNFPFVREMRFFIAGKAAYAGQFR